MFFTKKKKTTASTLFGDLVVQKHFINKSYTWQEFSWYFQEQTSVPSPEYENTSYVFNSKGYRCPEMESMQGPKILTIGCSESFGLGVPCNSRYSSVLCDLLSDKYNTKFNDLNLSICAASNDLISRSLCAATSLKPDLAIVCLTYRARREFFTSGGDVINFIPSVPLSNVKSSILDDWKAIKSLTHSLENEINLLKNFLLIKALDCNVIFIALEDNLPTMIEHDPKFIGNFRWIDTGMDPNHRGIRSHKQMADILFSKLTYENSQLICLDS